MQTLKIHNKGEYVITELDNGKVNALDTLMWKELKETFILLEKDESVRGVILSGKPLCFSAGLDIVHIVRLDLEGLRVFWREAMLAIQAMIRFSKPLVGAITGYSPAGGAILALTTDYRIMARGTKHVIGMHEFKLSLQIPEMLCDIYAYHMGEKEAWVAVQNARLYNSDEALEAGIVNESVTAEEVLSRAEKHMTKLLHVNNSVYALTKQYLRKNLLKAVDVDIEEHVDTFINAINNDDMKQMMELFVTSIKK